MKLFLSFNLLLLYKGGGVMFLICCSWVRVKGRGRGGGGEGELFLTCKSWVMVWGEGRGSCFLPVSLGLWYGERGGGVVSYLLVSGYGMGRGEGELFLTC